jgi:hypothetical protein
VSGVVGVIGVIGVVGGMVVVGDGGGIVVWAPPLQSHNTISFFPA